MTTANDNGDYPPRTPWWQEIQGVVNNESLPLFDGDARMIQQEEMRRIAARIQALADESGNVGCELKELGQSIARLASNVARDMAAVRAENKQLRTMLTQLMHRIGRLEEQLKAERFMVDAVSEMPVDGFWKRLWRVLFG